MGRQRHSATRAVRPRRQAAGLHRRRGGSGGGAGGQRFEPVKPVERPALLHTCGTLCVLVLVSSLVQQRRGRAVGCASAVLAMTDMHVIAIDGVAGLRITAPSMTGGFVSQYTCPAARMRHSHTLPIDLQLHWCEQQLETS